ncbi:uncharacterized protein F5147DRAFT_816272 [Suillus discolor]|uniref:Nephrocystin 3-like N-terminal domain-containing protein n=1 Tax=Suillus discolor TaxID=1912936 RepID=A0A9P7EZP8_9AGAM|nr:uncharacterized protein F5147DRAFT_816272 [Suillus discolor]KAG2097995.1 hypothetical protein F5147DRAFT_816272 [Suillus discolor]
MFMKLKCNAHPLSRANRRMISRLNLKDSRSRRGSVLPNNDRAGSSIPNIKVQDASAGVKQGADLQSVDKALRDASHAADQMNPLCGPARSVALSTGKNASAALDDIDSIEATYLQPFRIRTIEVIHPYAKWHWASYLAHQKYVFLTIISDRDKAILELYKKLGQMYGFVMQDDALRRIDSSADPRMCFIQDYLRTNFSKIVEFSVMAYAETAGLDIMKQCLPGTRTDILSDIMGWTNNSRDDIPRVIWLSGPAGTGKSAIAHTIASPFIGAGGLGSCYCFDRNTDDRHKKVFSTIARDLADRHPEMRRALADAVQNANALKTTADVVQQWQKLLIEPLGKLSESPVGPVMIIIDALDESGKAAETRSDLLCILAGKLRDPTIIHITKLPKTSGSSLLLARSMI